MLTAKLIVDRFDKDYRLLERREQPARSFVKQFIELLYIAHYQTAYEAPYTMTDIRGAEVEVDADIFAPATRTRGSKPTLVFGSPPGSSQNILHGGGGSASGPYLHMIDTVLMGEHLGIQVGGGDTEVTPTDIALETRFGHGVRVADGASVSFENYKVNDDGDYEMYGDKWYSQSFRPQHQHKLYSVNLKLFKEGTPGDVTVMIYAAQEDEPIGSALVTGTTNGNTLTEEETGEWREITFPSQIELIPGLSYAIVVHITGGGASDCIHWLYDGTTPLYYRGRYASSTNAGDSWSNSTAKDFMFEELGRSSGELQYGGCELVDLTFSDPNGEFTLRRFFINNSGESRTVNEAGIYASGAHIPSTTDAGWTYSFCIAHDIVSPGVAVANTELLRVTYVPQITV